MRKSFLPVLAALILSSVTYAAKKFPLTAASLVPGARGTVEIGTDKNGNTKVKVKVQHLASPESLTPPQNAYIVWFQQKGSNPETEGRLTVNKKLEGQFETTTPYKNFDLFITAEQDATTKSPSGTEVLRATVQP